MDAFHHLQSREDMSADQGPRLSATTTTLLVLATFFVALRFGARYVMGRLYGLDDWVMVGGLAVAFATGALNYSMLATGLGRHYSTLTMHQQEQFFKMLLAFECVYVTGIGLVKASVLLMYLRIFPSRSFRIAAAVIGSIVTAWWITIVLVCTFQCQPISKAWKPWLDGECLDLKASFIGNAIPNILTDVAILCMPVEQVLKLKINIAQKALVLFMFLLGSFVIFASIYRFTTLMQFQPSDTTWTLANACTWCVVEIASGAISGCLPTLRPLMVKISHSLGSLPGTSTPGTGGRSAQGSRHPTELVTFGGSGGPKLSTNGQFRRLENEQDRYGPKTTITRSESADVYKGSSDDELPLKDSIRVQVQHDVHVSETTTTDSAELSYNQKYSNYSGV